MQRGAAAAIALATLLHSPAQLWAQEVPSLQAGTILTIEPDRLIAGTKYGQAVQSRLDAVAAALQAENRQIDADLEAEEVALTARRGDWERRLREGAARFSDPAPLESLAGALYSPSPLAR